MGNRLTVFKATDSTTQITVKEDGTAIDITGQTLLFTVKYKHGGEADDSDALVEKTITSHTTPASGVSELVLTETDTDFTPGEYLYDFKRIDGGTIVGYDSGYFVVEDTITQRSS